MYPFDKTKSTFGLVLILLLSGSSSLWSQSRDLVVEEMQETVALWVFTVGVSQYEDREINLKYADNDALAIAEVFETQAGVLFREVFTRALTNEQATREEILKAMREFLGQASQDDVILIFMAGHGIQDPQTGTYYFLPHNATVDNLDYNGLQMHTFEEACRRLSKHTNKLVLFLDTCHAGAIRMAARGLNLAKDLSQPLKDELAQTLTGASGQYILSASQDGEISLEDKDWRLEGSDRGHGAFTYSLLRGLLGEAADKEGVIWLSDLFKHVNRQVARLTNGKQHPHGQLSGTDLPLFFSGRPGVEPPAVSTLPAFLPVKRQKGSRKWLWFLLGAAAAGGGSAAVLMGGGEEPSPPTGEIQIRVKVP